MRAVDSAYACAFSIDRPREEVKMAGARPASGNEARGHREPSLLSSLLSGTLTC